MEGPRGSAAFFGPRECEARRARHRDAVVARGNRRVPRVQACEPKFPKIDGLWSCGSIGRASIAAVSWPRRIVAPVEAFIAAHSTVSVERAVLRLLGVDGVDSRRGSAPQRDRRRARSRTSGPAASRSPSAARWPRPASIRRRLAKRLALRRFTLASSRDTPEDAARGALRPHVEAALRKIRRSARRSQRAARRVCRNCPPPLLYVIVASGNIYEDRTAAVAAAEAGAQVIAVIRSTGQSLLDFVPFGPTTEGFGGTYATQANFRIMRAALDEIAGTLRPLRDAHQLCERPLHAGDRRHGGDRAARHAAQRFDVRNSLPRHQHEAHVHRPALQPHAQRATPASSSTPAKTTI